MFECMILFVGDIANAMLDKGQTSFNPWRIGNGPYSGDPSVYMESTDSRRFLSHFLMSGYLLVTLVTWLPWEDRKDM